MKIEIENELSKLSFPILEKRIGVLVVTEMHQLHWLDKVLSGQAKCGAGELYEKKGKWYVSLSVLFESGAALSASSNVLVVVDVGLNYFGCCFRWDKFIIFSGKRRHRLSEKGFLQEEKNLGKLKNLKAIKKERVTMGEES